MATISYQTLINDMKTFDSLVKAYDSSLNATSRATFIAAFCRMPHYGDLKWHLALSGINPIFVSYVKSHNLGLYNRYYNYGKTDQLFMQDKNGKIVDVPHMFAVLQAFLVAIIQKEWFSWGGDLASSINPILNNCNGSSNFDTVIKATESYLFSSGGSFPQDDLNADFDGEYIAYQVKNYGKALPDAIEYYYNSLSSGRYMLVINLHGGNDYNFDNYVHGIMGSSALKTAFGFTANDTQRHAIVGTYISKLRRLL